jgi:hypothetical protein
MGGSGDCGITHTVSDVSQMAFFGSYSRQAKEEVGMRLGSRHWRTVAMVMLIMSGILPISGLVHPLSAADPKPLSLDDCVQMALDAAPELREAEQDVLAAQADLSQAKAGQWAQMEVIGIAGPVNDADQPRSRFDRMPTADFAAVFANRTRRASGYSVAWSWCWSSRSTRSGRSPTARMLQRAVWRFSG